MARSTGSGERHEPAPTWGRAASDDVEELEGLRVACEMLGVLDPEVPLVVPSIRGSCLSIKRG